VIAHIADVNRGLAAQIGDFTRDHVGIFGTDIDDLNRCAVGGKLQRDGAANAAARPGNDGSFSVQPKFASS